jgi:hypothetical protein
MEVPGDVEVDQREERSDSPKGFSPVGSTHGGRKLADQAGPILMYVLCTFDLRARRKARRSE